MRVSLVRFLALALMAGCALITASPAQGENVNVPLNGVFNAGVSGSGSATLNGASGNFKQWLLFTHANIGVSANPQTVGINVNPVAATNYSASGSSSLTYEPDVNFGGPSPTNVESLNADLNGNTSIHLGLTVNPININTSLGTFQLQLTFNGSIDDLTFTSTGSSEIPGADYVVPGNYNAVLNGSVTGKLVNVPLISTVDLGTLYTLDPNTVVSVEGAIPGQVNLADGSGGAGPYPSSLLANYAFSFPDSISFPLDLPFDIAINQNIPSKQSGFNTLNASGAINATLTLNNVSYNLNGSVPAAVVPEPTSVALAAIGGLGLALAGLRRHRRR